jgi:outer membrane protein
MNHREHRGHGEHRDGKNNFSFFLSVLSLFSVSSVVAFSGGCIRFGTGGTGELVVRERTLREIDVVDVADYAVPAPPLATQPTTNALTRPTSRPAPAEYRLLIEDVRRLALHNNLDLRVELINPTIARTSLSEEEARFEALFTANVDYTKFDSATASRLTSAQGENLNANAGVSLPLQTGGTVRLDVPVNRAETDNEFSTLNPSYASDVSASISQPLLRGAGVAANAASIRLAFYDLQATEARTKLEIIRVLAVADRLYWRLYAARQELIVRKQEYDLAIAQLERARRFVRAEQLPEVEIIRAESGVADTLEAIITAENAVRDRQRDLKRTLNEVGLGMETDTILVPATEPNALYFKLDPEHLAAVALDKRMEMLELELRIAADAASLEAAKNATLPLVTLDYTYNVNGLGATFDESFGVTGDRDFEDHRVGLRVDVPLGNEAARSRLRRAILARVQRLATREQRVLQIRQEVFNAVDQLEANWQRIVAARQRTVLAARVLAAEIRQFEQGLRTSTEVLDAQTRLANAKSAEIAAVTEYQISQIDVTFATGTLLGANKVVWTPAPMPK